MLRLFPGLQRLERYLHMLETAPVDALRNSSALLREWTLAELMRVENFILTIYPAVWLPRLLQSRRMPGFVR
jgi:hypothetical protein